MNVVTDTITRAMSLRAPPCPPPRTCTARTCRRAASETCRRPAACSLAPSARGTRRICAPAASRWDRCPWKRKRFHWPWAWILTERRRPPTSQNYVAARGHHPATRGKMPMPAAQTRSAPFCRNVPGAGELCALVQSRRVGGALPVVEAVGDDFGRLHGGLAEARIFDDLP